MWHCLTSRRDWACSSAGSTGLADESIFDAFDRLIKSGATTYEYDGLDRLISRNGVRGFSYIGLSPELAADPTSTYGHGVGTDLISLAQDGEKVRRLRRLSSERDGPMFGVTSVAGSTHWHCR